MTEKNLLAPYKLSRREDFRGSITSSFVSSKGAVQYVWRVKSHIWEPICEVTVIMLNRDFHFLKVISAYELARWQPP
jgi:hypothetical protein